MMQLFKQFGITQFDFTSVKVTIGLMVIILVKLVMNIFLKLKQEQMMQVLLHIQQ
jgi:ABC-type lipoprotein release transport system permease subunit